MRKIGVKLGEKFHSKTDLIVRQQLLAPGRYHKTVVVWLAEVASLRRLLRMFTETAMFCFQACSHLSFRILTDINNISYIYRNNEKDGLTYNFRVYRSASQTIM